MKVSSSIWKMLGKILGIEIFAYLAIALIPAYAESKMQETSVDLGKNCQQLPQFGADSLIVSFEWNDETEKPRKVFLKGL